MNAKSETVKTRLTYLDCLKGIAAILVAFGHSNNRFAEALASGRLLKVSAVIYSFHMPLFVFLSGMVFALSYKTITERQSVRLRTAIWNLSILYLFYDAVFVLSKWLIGGFISEVSWSDLLLLPIRSVGELWYLYVMILCYVLFSFEFWECKNKNFFLLVFFGISTMSTALYNNTFDNRSFWFSWPKDLFLLFFFYCGMRYAKKDKFLHSKVVVYVSFSLSLVLLILFGVFGFTLYKLPGLSTLTGFGITLGLVTLFQSVNVLGNSRLLAFVGRHALDIYLIHLYIIEVLWRIYGKFSFLPASVGILLITALSVGLSLAIAVILEKANLYDLFFRPIKFFKRKQK